MKFKKSSNLLQAGETSKLFLVLAVIILVAAVIVYLVIKMAEQPSNPVEEPTETAALPVYEQTLENIKFVFESAINHGDTLYASESVNSTYSSSYQTNLTTTENFIEVKVGAQNVGKVNMDAGTWDIENIVDSEGREYVPLEEYSIRAWLPNTDLCGTLLKPSFDPTPCIKIYEVSKKSTGLKIRVVTGKNNGNVGSDMEDNESALIDLIVK